MEWLLFIQVYVDDLIIGATNNVFCQEFSNFMSKDFEISMTGEHNFFLGLQIKQCQDGIFVNQNKYVKELLKKYKLDEVKHTSTLMALNSKLI